jgi:hypothetical protein
MANKKKALRVSPFDDAEIEASIFGVSPEARVTRKKAGKVAIEQKGNEASGQGEKEPMEKIAVRLPRSLAVEFQRVYLDLAVKHFDERGAKLTMQDCHVEMVRDWVEKQNKKLAKLSHGS